MHPTPQLEPCTHHTHTIPTANPIRVRKNMLDQRCTVSAYEPEQKLIRRKYNITIVYSIAAAVAQVEDWVISIFFASGGEFSIILLVEFGRKQSNASFYGFNFGSLFNTSVY